MADPAYWLTNVRLETGYRYENGTVTGRRTFIIVVGGTLGLPKRLFLSRNSILQVTPSRESAYLRK